MSCTHCACSTHHTSKSRASWTIERETETETETNQKNNIFQFYMLMFDLVFNTFLSRVLFIRLIRSLPCGRCSSIVRNQREKRIARIEPYRTSGGIRFDWPIFHSWCFNNAIEFVLFANSLVHFRHSRILLYHLFENTSRSPFLSFSLCLPLCLRTKQNNHFVQQWIFEING